MITDGYLKALELRDMEYDKKEPAVTKLPNFFRDIIEHTRRSYSLRTDKHSTQAKYEQEALAWVDKFFPVSKEERKAIFLENILQDSRHCFSEEEKYAMQEIICLLKEKKDTK